jgi:hypothetical protein
VGKASLAEFIVANGAEADEEGFRAWRFSSGGCSDTYKPETFLVLCELGKR